MGQEEVVEFLKSQYKKDKNKDFTEWQIEQSLGRTRG